MRLHRRLAPFAAGVVTASLVTTGWVGLAAPAATAVPAAAGTTATAAATATAGGAGIARPASRATLRAAHDPSGAPHIQSTTPMRSRALDAVSSSVDTANITVTYAAGFDPAARTAFQAAVDIWRRRIVSPVPIHVVASWSPLGSSDILGQAGPSAFRRDFSGAPRIGTYYPDALANALAGHDLDPAHPEIEASFNSTFPNWYKGTDGRPGPDRYDFESVVLHELGHGLGFVGTFDGLTPPNWTDTGKGYWGLAYAGDAPSIFDRYAVDGSARAALNTAVYPQGSTALGGLLRGSNGGVQWSGANGVAGAGGSRPRLYSPTAFEEGSSFAHLDEATYPAGSANALMTPYLTNNEVVREPGPIVSGMMLDVGWSASAPSTNPAITAKYQSLGGAAGVLGPATSVEFQTDNGAGRFVNYRNGAIYWSPGTGAHEVHGSIRAKWQSLGGASGVLGLPVTDESVASDGVGRYNDFQGGSLYWTSSLGAWLVKGNIRNKWLSLGGVRSVLGYPTTDERTTPDGVGRYNHFQSGSVYWTPGTGAHEVHGSIRTKWGSLGWERGRLGYPTSDEFAISGGRRNTFQHGSISWNSRTYAVTVVYS